MPEVRKPRPALPAQPGTLRAASLLWLVISALLVVAAGSFLVSANLQEQDRAGLTGLAAILAALAAVQLVLVLRLRRGRRSARELLTTVAVIAGVPVLVRGTPGLSLIAAAMLAAAALMWLPRSGRWLQQTDPKARKRRLPRS